MKTTTVRKLLPESWGFMCPVHTPDGSPCGLLNHISLACIPLPTEEIDMKQHIQTFKRLLTQMGMNPVGSDLSLINPVNYLPVLLDGQLLGYINPTLAPQLVRSLRGIKMMENRTDELYSCVPKSLEIAFLPSNEINNKDIDSSNKSTSDSSDGQTFKEKFFPGISMASTPARFIRPVKNLELGGVEFIGPLEQVNMSIACLEEDLRTDTTHQEIDPLNILSIIASCVPFCDYNQSPRNMYQC